MEVQVKEWGNSQGIRIPKSVMKEAGFQMYDILDVRVSHGQIVLAKPFRHKTLRERIEESGKPLQGIGELDWGEPVGSEVW